MQYSSSDTFSFFPASKYSNTIINFKTAMSLRDYIRNLVSDCAAAQTNNSSIDSDVVSNMQVTIVSDNSHSYYRSSSCNTDETPDDTDNHSFRLSDPLSVTTHVSRDNENLSTCVSTVLDTWDILEDDLFRTNHHDIETDMDIEDAFGDCESDDDDDYESGMVVTTPLLIRSSLGGFHNRCPQVTPPRGSVFCMPIPDDTRRYYSEKVPKVSLHPRNTQPGGHPIPPPHEKHEIPPLRLD